MIIQRLFARRDYEGLGELEKAELKNERSYLAKELRDAKKKINQRVGEKQENLKKATDVYVNTDKLPKGGAEEYYKGVEGAHGKEVRQMVGELNSGKSVGAIEKDITNYRNSRYDKNLKNIKEDAKWAREEALNRTERSKKKTAAIENVRKADQEKVAKETAKREEKLVRKAARSKMLKKAGIGTLIAGGTIAAGVGAKKLIDKRKKERL